MKTTTDNLKQQVQGVEGSEVVEFGCVSAETRGGWLGHTGDPTHGLKWP